jgi:hypothetical protein
VLHTNEVQCAGAQATAEAAQLATEKLSKRCTWGAMHILQATADAAQLAAAPQHDAGHAALP